MLYNFTLKKYTQTQNYSELVYEVKTFIKTDKVHSDGTNYLILN